MNKTAFLLLISFTLSVLAQLPNPGPRCPRGAPGCDYMSQTNPSETGETTFAAATDWSSFNLGRNSPSYNGGICIIVWVANGNPVYTSTLNRRKTRDVKPTFNRQANKNIDTIYYYGECYCWINLFSGASYQGNSIGFWSSATSADVIYLTDYQSYNQNTGVWNQWDRSTSSYWVNCYFN